MPVPRRVHRIVPEVVQSSGMDCGPAALKSFLAGCGISLSYGRLREACQTDVDGTAIETLEELATGLGAPLEQVLLPKDAVLLEEARALPAIVVFRLPNGNTHFAVVWSLSAGVVQVMDPAAGRRWMSRAGLLEELYEHVMSVPSSDWRAWAASEEALAILRRRLHDLGVRPETSASLEASALSDPGASSLAALDASLRLVRSRLDEGEVKRGAPAEELVVSSFERARRDRSTIHARLWTVRADEANPDHLVVRGAVLLRFPKDGGEPRKIELPPAVLAARDEEPPRPARELWRWVRREGLLAPWALATAAVLSATTLVLEGLLFRAFLELPDLFGALGLLLLVALVLDASSIAGELRLGRRLERGLRHAFQRKIPKLADRYFASRLTSDMAERLHSLHGIRRAPGLARELLREGAELLLTAGALLWLAPSTAPIVLAALAAAVVIPIAGQAVLFERDARVRSHLGGLSRFYLDALLGLVPLRVHGAEGALRSEHETLLASWARARLALQRATVSLETIQFAVAYGLIVLLVFSYVRGGGEPASILLLAYWALNLPVLGLQMQRLLWRYPEMRHVFLRAIEPLGAPDERDLAPRAEDVDNEGPSLDGALAIRLENVSVRVSGHRLLEDIDVAIDPGSHVAIVGPSGAGKTTLLGLLLGFHFPDAGRVLVNGSVLGGDRLTEVRARTAWVDPGVQLWNQTLTENLLYGNEVDSPVETAIAESGLAPVADRVGRDTLLGEGGTLVSGGEGQRARLARALLRKDVGLALLDEPFRGLDRESRAELSRRARAHFGKATLLAITHDVSETASFDRVLVLEGGRLVEDGAPGDLARREHSVYRRLLDSERKLWGLWADRGWRAWRIEEGEVRVVR